MAITFAQLIQMAKMTPDSLTPKQIAEAPFVQSFAGEPGRPVPDEWKQELYNYLVIGLTPGSFHAAVFANDLSKAAVTSHKLNTWKAITSLVYWIVNKGPNAAFGSHARVDAWLALAPQERKDILVKARLLRSDEEVVWHTLTH